MQNVQKATHGGMLKITKQIASRINESKDLFFKEGISDVISREARRILGSNRPLNDDDQEYYALCDKLYEQAVRKIQSTIANIDF
jgi:hypothetical protein